MLLAYRDGLHWSGMLFYKSGQGSAEGVLLDRLCVLLIHRALAQGLGAATVGLCGHRRDFHRAQHKLQLL